MSLGGAIESILKHCLGPFVEDLDVSHLHTSILRGGVKLNNIKFKKDLLSLCGLEGFQLDNSQIGSIQVHIPWNSVFTGRTSVVIEGVNANVLHTGIEDDDELLESIRNGRRQALAARVEQLRALAQQRKAAQAYVEEKKNEENGFLANMIYKFVNNLTLKVEGVGLGFKSPNFGVGLQAGVGEVAVLSADPTFTQTSDKHSIHSHGSDVHKLLRVTGLFAQMTTLANAGTEDETAYVLTPCSMSIKLSHQPSQELVKVQLEFGTDRDNEIVVSQKQLSRLVSAQAAIAQEQAYSQNLLAPKFVAKPILRNEEQSKEEYGQLYYKKVLKRFMTDEEQERLHVLEDVLPLQLLAAQRTVAEEAADELFSRYKITGIMGRLSSIVSWATFGCVTPPEPKLPENLDQSSLSLDTTLAQSFEHMDAPQNININVQSGRLVVRVIDDRFAEDIPKYQLLEANLLGTRASVLVKLGEDYKGNSSADLNVECVVRQINAQHAGQKFICLSEDYMKMKSEEMAATSSASDEDALIRFNMNSSLEVDHNLLRVKLRALPLDIHFPPSLLQQGMDFANSLGGEELPRQTSTGSNRSSGSDTPTRGRSTNFGDDSALNGETAAQWVDEFAKRAPDRIALDIGLMAGLVHVPMEGVGQVMMNLGNLTVSTPGPCELTDFHLAVNLSNTCMRTISHVGEVFQVLQPMKLGLELYQHQDDGEDGTVTIAIETQIGKAAFAMGPHQLQIIMSVVAAMTPPASAVPEMPDDYWYDMEQQAITDALQGSDVAAKLEAFAKRRVEVNVDVRGEALSVDLWDYSVPFLHLESQLVDGVSIRSEGLASGEEQRTKVQVPEIKLHLTALNSRNGAWEPLLEDLCLGVDVESVPSSIEGSLESATVTNIICNSSTGLLLNVVPTSLQRAVQLVPNVISCLEPIQEKKGGGTGTTSGSHAWTKYRAVNLTDMVIHVEVEGGGDERQVRIEPTGSDWVALDELLVVGDARAWTVRLENGSRSTPLRLERCGAVTVPGTRFIAELMSHREGHRVLLLAPAMKLHNTTDIPLFLRFFNFRGEELENITKKSMICDGNVIGHYSPDYKTVSQYTEKYAPPTTNTSTEGLLLPPNCVCAVPPQLMLEGKHSVQLSLKPAIKGSSYCEMQSLGVGHDKSSVISCKRVMLDAPLAPVAVARKRGGSCVCFSGKVSEPFGADDSQGEMLHFRVDVIERSNPLPEPTEPTTFTTLVLRPTLTLLNAVPIKNLIVECANGEGVARWYPATIPKMTGHNFYCSSSNRASLRAKLDEEGAWSKMLNIRLDAPPTSASSQTLELSAVRGEGSAGGLMEIIGPAQVRVCCPLWFVERAGLSSLGTLRLTNEDAILPSADGLSLLPADCFDDPIEMTLHTEHSGQMRQRMKMPPSHDTFSWKSSAGRLNMCLQTEDVAPAGVLGARCKVLILRPRMMVTNSSSKDLELCIFGPGEKKPATLLGSFSGVAAASRGISNTLLSRDSSKKEEDTGGSGSAAATTATASSSQEQGEAKRNWSMKRILDGMPLARNAESQQKKSSSTTETSWHLQEGQVLILPAGTSKELHFDPEQSGIDAKALAAMLGFRERGQEAWAGPVLCSEETIGRRAWAVQRGGNGANDSSHRKSHGGPSVLDVAVAASRGGLSVTFDSDAELIAANRIVKATPSMVVKPWAKPGSECEFKVPLKRKVPIGWPQPALDENAWKVDVVIEGKSYTIQDVRQAKRAPVVLEDGRTLELSLARHGSNILMTLEEASILASKQDSVLNLSLAIPRIGVSVISEEGPAASELLFLAVDGVAVQYSLNSSTDTENLRVAVADLQLDCQLNSRIEGVNDGNDRPGNPKQFATRRRQAVLLCKKEGEDEVDFVSLQWQREAASSQDMLFSMLSVALPKIDIVFDDEWFNPLLNVMLSIGGDAAQDLGFSYSKIIKDAGKPLAQGYTPPALPSVLQVEGFQLSAVDLTVSASLPFESFDFLPKYARKILQVLCISRHFSLNHAHIRLPSKEIPASRGSAVDFGIGLAHEYTFSLIMNVAAVLGKSSLLNLPAAPIKLGGAAVALVTDRLSGATGEVATKLSALAMDSRYMQRRQERKEQRQINHAGEGVVEASKSLADGVKGVFDIVRKPIEGARDGGCGGFARGIGEGVAGTVVKPIVGVGSAISDLGSGIAATAAAGPRLRLRHGDQHTRTRMPRLMFGELGEVRFYSTAEAALLQEYGAEFTHAVSEVVPLVNESLRSIILMLFREKAILVEVRAHNDLALHSEAEKKKKSGEKTLLQQRFGHAFTPIPKMHERAREFKFTNLNGAQLDYKDHHKFALIIDDKHGHKHELFIYDQIVSEEALLALCEGLQTAAKDPRHRANWRPLRRELNDAKLASALDTAYSTSNETTNSDTLIVIEVQRRSHEKDWSVPFLPSDWDLSWRWVDMRGKRHPRLDADRSQKDIVEWSRPPCDMDTRRFKATSDWEVSVQDSTDNEGWTYAPTWGTTQWHKEVSASDCLRRRVWQKHYTRRPDTSSSKLT